MVWGGEITIEYNMMACVLELYKVGLSCPVMGSMLTEADGVVPSRGLEVI
jgi:hypothetical protein